MGYQIKLPMDNQYYTPSVEEFNVGFEYEMIYSIYHPNGVAPSEQWQNKLVDQYTILSTIVGLLNTGRIRVRCLNREDIESLGFSLFGKGDKTFHIKTNTVYMILLSGDKTFITKDVFLPDKSTANTTVFEGTIKNRSELSRIMKQIGMI